MFLKIDIRLFYKLVIIFILMTVAGTLHHECGHLIAGKCIGIDSRINYYSTRLTSESRHQIAYLRYIDSLFPNLENTDSVTRKKSFTQLKLSDKKFRDLLHTIRKDNIVFTLGGPLITMLTGTIGFVILILVNVKSKTETLNFKQYSLVFISLLWLRQPMNLVMGIIHYLINPERRSNCDEFHIAFYFNLNHWTVLIITGIIGFMIASYIVFRIIPAKVRLTFILAGMVGGLLGYYLWLIKLGPIIMP